MLWYQTLGRNAPNTVHNMFAELVPGLSIPQTQRIALDTTDYSGGDFADHPNMKVEAGTAVLHDMGVHPVKCPEITALLPPSSSDKSAPPDPKDGIEMLLECMVQSCGCIKWRDNSPHRHMNNFAFLLNRFREVYLPSFCPDFDYFTSVYEPKLELPVMRNVGRREELMSSCVVVLVNWVSKYTYDKVVLNRLDSFHMDDSDMGENSSLLWNLRHMGYSQAQLVRDVLYSTKDMINFVHEVYRQAFLLGYTSKAQIDAMKVSISVYRDWMSNAKPPFLLEPGEMHSMTDGQVNNNNSSSSMTTPPRKLRTDSYIGAISKENVVIRAGLQNVLQVFVTNAANVFMVQTGHLNLIFPSKMGHDQPSTPLDEQTDICKRVLNIYRTMVMNTRMEPQTWEQLLLVLLQVTKLLLQQSGQQTATNSSSSSKRTNLGSRLAQPIFQTLIVTWIRAHTNVPVNIILWEKFLTVLASLTHREELIVEWDKTMQTLTRVLARQVYNLNLQDLPLDRLAETKGKRRRGVSSWQTSSERDQPGIADGSVSIMTTTSNKSVGEGGNCTVDTKTAGHLRRHLLPGTPGLNRSYSEGSLAPSSALAERHRRAHCRKNGRLKNHPIALLADDGKRSSHSQLMNVSLSTSTDNLNISRISTGSQQGNQHNLGRTPSTSTKLRRAISLDSVRPQCAESGRGSRSPSPTASSGMEGGSIKDSPLQIDGLAGDSSSIDTQDDGSAGGSLTNDRRSIMAGGGARGWLPDVAAIMWKRMLGCLGDVNQIQNPKLHAQVFKYLVEITNNLIKIRMNQGVSLDSQTAPPVTTLMPPIGLVAPWCYGALTLDAPFREGKLWALQLLCSIARNSSNLGQEQLPLFYQAVHLALTSEDRAMAYAVLKHLGGPKFLSLLIPGHSLLLLDLVHVATVVVSSADTTPNTPRFEVAGLLGSLLCCPITSIPATVLHPSGPHIELFDCPDLQEHVLNVVMRCARREPTARARCIAISSLSQWICFNLGKVTRKTSVGKSSSSPPQRSGSTASGKKLSRGEAIDQGPRIKEAFQIILQALQFKHRTIARVASESLKLCAEKGRYIARIDKLPQMIINSICIALEVQNVRSPKEADKIVLNSLILCLGEFCMNIPVAILRLPVCDGSPVSVILSVLKILHQLGGGSQSDRIKLFTADEDFEMSINVDDIREQIQSDPGYQTAETTQNCLTAIRLCARTVAMHLVTNIGHFPMGIGASRLSSLVEEHDDSTFVAVNPASGAGSTMTVRDSMDVGIPHLLNSPNMQMFMLNPSLVASFIELSALKLPGGGITAGLVTAQKQVRILLRDINGKSCWDASILYREPKINLQTHAQQQQQHNQNVSKTGLAIGEMRQLPYHVRMMQNRSLMMGASLDPLISNVGFPMPPLRHTLRHRPANQLPLAKDIAPDLDQLDDLLQYIGHTSPECLENGVPLNFTGQSPMGANTEGHVISTILNQKSLETEYLARQSYQFAGVEGGGGTGGRGHGSSSSVSHYFGGSTVSTVGVDFESCSSSEREENATSLENCRRFSELQPFHLCRLLFSQLGLATSQEKRKRTNLLARSEKLLRELRNLDTQRCRETHKMAVIYVGSGQEDKVTILRNNCGSSTYEMFVSALGWEVELETHNGFLGGLPRTGCGSTAPYYATPFLEVIFHVATRMPSDTPEAILTKTRHLGNDEVHIVWSEHGRDYRRDILPTEFCDVLIAVYPLRSGLFRVTINRKPEVPWFGPIWDECVVGGSCLASFVRATAINASRAKRASLPFYQQL